MTSARPRHVRSALPAGQLTLRAVPMILMYHAVAEVPEDPHQLCVAPARFAEQMTWLARHGLRGVSVGTLVEAMRVGQHRRMVGITFDDGYRTVLEAAVPELQRHGFGATAFIISGRLGATNEWDEGPSWQLVDAAEVRQLAAAGVEIGSHGATHVRLAGADADELIAEIEASRASLSALVGAEVRGFAYPYGSMDHRVRIAVREAGYQYACAVETARHDIDILALPRVYIGQHDRAARMMTKRLLYKGYIVAKGRRR